MNGLRLQLPATSANLGPGFDALALALNLYLEIEARAAVEFSIVASGRNPEICAATERNLLLDVYRTTLAARGCSVRPLALKVRNEIPVGMGCGSSAAVRLAGVALASHFGGLDWTREEILSEATRLEGHPDNIAACWMGGFVAGCWDGNKLSAVSFAPPQDWQALVVLPEKPLATVASRSVLPEMYSRTDVVANLQRVAVLTAAFAAGRGDLIAEAMRDRMHQPYRSEVCPLLEPLLTISEKAGVLGVALSGAGPAVLILVDSDTSARRVAGFIPDVLPLEESVEILHCKIETSQAQMSKLQATPQ